MATVIEQRVVEWGDSRDAFLGCGGYNLELVLNDGKVLVFGNYPGSKEPEQSLVGLTFDASKL